MNALYANMRDKHDHLTLSLLQHEDPTIHEKPTVAKRGRPKKIDALSAAERARHYRERKKIRLAELRDITKPISSSVIDLSALPAWKRKGWSQSNLGDPSRARIEAN